MTNYQLKKLKAIFRAYPKIKLIYFFGSKAQGRAGPLSDYDFAVYLNEKDKKAMFELRFVLMDKICRLLKTDKVDVVILNLIEGPELKYQIIKEGRLIFERKPFKVLVEPRIFNEYFDFHQFLLSYGMTRG